MNRSSAPPHSDDEEARADSADPARRELGAYFTPAPLAELMLERAREILPSPAQVIDPACGAGAFLSRARRHFPSAALVGFELSARYAAECRQRAPSARVHGHDALSPALDRLLPLSGPELWIGNPPFNGTSPQLRNPERYSSLRAQLPLALPPGTSLRDDFSFFLLRAATRIAKTGGALAFITPATLLDAFLYAPLRQWLLETLTLAGVFELGAGVFSTARVRACVTFWSTRPGRRPPRFIARAEPGPFSREQLLPAQTFMPVAPDWILRPIDPRATALHARWTSLGEPLTTAVPISLPGLKTRFDELLVDDDRERLVERMRDFLATRRSALETFAARHALPPRTHRKLLALHEVVRAERVAFEGRCVRPFFRYAGARHRNLVPESARQFCYLDRRLIPRGDHRMRGGFDPHVGALKLLFNVRELPLAAAVLDREGCVHDHRHTRFAPALVPERIRREGLSAARTGSLEKPVLNLSARALRLAERIGVENVFPAIARFINSEPVQQIWAPAWGAFRVLPIPLDALLPDGSVG